MSKALRIKVNHWTYTHKIYIKIQTFKLEGGVSVVVSLCLPVSLKIVGSGPMHNTMQPY